MRRSVRFNTSTYEFFLPGHKGDCFFEGNCVVIQGTNTPDNPMGPFTGTSMPRTMPILGDLNYGFTPMAQSLHALGSCGASVLTSPWTSVANQCVLVVPRHLQKLVSLLTSFRASAVGLLTPSKFTSTTTPHCWLFYYSQPSTTVNCELHHLTLYDSLPLFCLSCINMTRFPLCITISYIYLLPLYNYNFPTLYYFPYPFGYSLLLQLHNYHPLSPSSIHI